MWAELVENRSIVNNYVVYVVLVFKYPICEAKEKVTPTLSDTLSRLLKSLTDSIII